MEAAIIASRRGHEVILCEKEGKLGGLLNVVEESFKERIGKYKNYLIYQLGKSAVDVRLNTEVTPELIEQIQPDVVFAAVGGHPILPPIKGIEKAIQILIITETNRKSEKMFWYWAADLQVQNVPSDWQLPRKKDRSLKCLMLSLPVRTPLTREPEPCNWMPSKPTSTNIMSMSC